MTRRGFISSRENNEDMAFPAKENYDLNKYR